MSEQHKRQPVKGETLFLVRTQRNLPPYTKEVVVKSVGRLCFKVGESESSRAHLDITFRLDDWVEKTDYPSNVCLYESERDYLEQKRKGALLNQLQRVFGWDGSGKKLSLDQLERIAAVVGEEKSS